MDHFNEYIFSALKGLLILFEPLENSIPVEIKYANLRKYPGENMPDCRDLVNPEGFKRNSPLLFYFVRLFSIISHYLDFYDRDHKKRSINGIKIRDNEIWTMKSSGSPNEVMGYITGKCGRHQM